jgi:hypothetical protein
MVVTGYVFALFLLDHRDVEVLECMDQTAMKVLLLRAIV